MYDSYSYLVIIGISLLVLSAVIVALSMQIAPAQEISNSLETNMSNAVVEAEEGLLESLMFYDRPLTRETIYVSLLKAQRYIKKVNVEYFPNNSTVTDFKKLEKNFNYILDTDFQVREPGLTKWKDINMKYYVNVSRKDDTSLYEVILTIPNKWKKPIQEGKLIISEKVR